jgi:hypothetical protein
VGGRVGARAGRKSSQKRKKLTLSTLNILLNKENLFRWKCRTHL